METRTVYYYILYYIKPVSDIQQQHQQQSPVQCISNYYFLI